jgi:hypothetical protein
VQRPSAPGQEEGRRRHSVSDCAALCAAIHADCARSSCSGNGRTAVDATGPDSGLAMHHVTQRIFCPCIAPLYAAHATTRRTASRHTTISSHPATAGHVSSRPATASSHGAHLSPPRLPPTTAPRPVTTAAAAATASCLHALPFLALCRCGLRHARTLVLIRISNARHSACS